MPLRLICLFLCIDITHYWIIKYFLFTYLKLILNYCGAISPTFNLAFISDNVSFDNICFYYHVLVLMFIWVICSSYSSGFICMFNYWSFNILIYSYILVAYFLFLVILFLFIILLFLAVDGFLWSHSEINLREVNLQTFYSQGLYATHVERDTKYINRLISGP